MKINKKELIAQERLMELLIYCFESGNFTWVGKSSPKSNIKIGQTAGGVGKNGYIVIWINYTLYYAHHLVWLYVHGSLPVKGVTCIDHINGNPSNNRVDNLREVSHAVNMRNKKMNVNNKSGVTGVRIDGYTRNGKTYQYWAADWYDGSNKYHIKRFSIKKLGYDQARELATLYRCNMLQLLELNHGITYSDRHGT